MLPALPSPPVPVPVPELTAALPGLGARPLHVQALLRQWLAGRPPGPGKHRPEDHLPAALVQQLPALQAAWAALAQRRSTHPAADGAERWLLALADGQTVETVLLPRGGLCVSTQVGCAVGCRFCMTGRDGLLRQLSAAEILAQVALARQVRPVRRVVLMGMGEPAHNLDAVLQAVQVLGTLGGVAHKQIVFSTVGDERAFAALPRGRVQPALALSLHSLDAARRAWLLPRAPRIAPEALLDHAEAYGRATRHPVLLQWTLIEDVNDGDDEFERLAALLPGRRLLLNLIPVNAVDAPQAPGDPAWRRPPREAAVALLQRLRAAGVPTTLRWSAAQDVEGGCGQLRARQAAPRPVRVHRRTESTESTAAA
jgi:23S rRNA (adenine2503-C2)-methyltransferase